jgi:pSer/pThr/pTyr-binding forkhead associated (FHA) protein
MKLSLLILTPGKQEGKKLPISLAQFVIGRDPQCQLRPASPLISKRHCALVQRDGKIFLHDFESTNGSFVNGQRVVGEIELHQDDRVKVGPIEFSIQLEGAPAGRPTPAPARSDVKPAKADANKPAPKKEKAEEEKGTVTQAALEETKTVQPPAKGKPKPPEKEKEKEKTSSADDDVAAMLLSLHDDDDADASGGDPVPEGTTEMEIRVPPEVADKEDAKESGKDAPKDAKKPEQSKEAKAKAGAGNTQNAAKDILEKMMRRPR